MNRMKKIFLTISLLFPLSIYAQDNEVIEQLKNIEKGDIKEAQKELVNLKSKYPGNPSIMFLEGVLKTDGQDALRIYTAIYEKYPKSSFADASLYRMFSYYYSAGLYKKAEETLKKLKLEYPESPYIRAADRTIPEEFAPEVQQAAEPEKPPVEKTGIGKFTVQAGAFINIQNAESLKKNLETDGFVSEITTKEVGGTMLNVVLAGKFNTERNADSLIIHLDKKYHLKGRIVPIVK